MKKQRIHHSTINPMPQIPPTMDSDRKPHTDRDQPDHSAGSAYAYKNEVSLSIGYPNDGDLAAPKSESTPTPSPRLYGGSTADDHNSDDSASTHVPSPNNSNSNDSAVLMRHHQSDDLSRVGLDNPGFETEPVAPAARPLSSFGQPNGNGNGKPTEAVNLELVNLPSKTTTVVIPSREVASLPAKKETTTVNINDNYDEYFVPVNEHRKYMR